MLSNNISQVPYLILWVSGLAEINSVAVITFDIKSINIRIWRHQKPTDACNKCILFHGPNIGSRICPTGTHVPWGMFIVFKYLFKMYWSAIIPNFNL